MTVKEYFKETCGYDIISTFWDDFTIAEHFGMAAIKDTYNRAKKGWKHDYKMMTELTLILNHKIWQKYDHGNGDYELARLYNSLWEDCDEWCTQNLKDEELEYFLRITD